MRNWRLLTDVRQKEVLSNHTLDQVNGHASSLTSVTVYVVSCCREASTVLPTWQQTGNLLWDSFVTPLWEAHLSYCNSQKGFCLCWHLVIILPLLYQREKGASQEAHVLARNSLKLTIRTRSVLQQPLCSLPVSVSAPCTAISPVDFQGSPND